MKQPRDPNAARPRVTILLCLACGRRLECQPADMLRFTRAGWPRCCGAVMSFVNPDPVPDPPVPPLAPQPKP